MNSTEHPNVILVIDPPLFRANSAFFPEWVGQACIGLQLTDKQLQHFSATERTVLWENLVAELRKQNPHPRSIEAATMIDEEYVALGGEIKFPVEALLLQ